MTGSIAENIFIHKFEVYNELFLLNQNLKFSDLILSDSGYLVLLYNSNSSFIMHLDWNFDTIWAYKLSSNFGNK